MIASSKQLKEGWSVLNDSFKETDSSDILKGFEERIALLDIETKGMGILSTSMSDNVKTEQELEKMRRKGIEITPEMIEALDIIQGKQREIDALYKEHKETLGSQNEVQGRLTGTTIAQVAALTDLETRLIAEQAALGENSPMWATYAEAIANVKEEMEAFAPEAEKMFSEEQIETMAAFQEGWSMIANTATMYFESVKQGHQKEMEDLRNSDAFKRVNWTDDKARRKAQEADIKKLEDSQRAKKQKAWKQQQQLTMGGIIMDTAGAVMKIWKDVPKVDFGIWTSILTGMALAAGAAQLAIVGSQSMPSFAQGGLIGGRRHAQGGTNINAEAGEFVMSRNAVQSAGLETLNQINAGGGGGQTINVSVEGNVMTEDFVETELAEKISEAIRRGADFGIS